MGLPFKLWRIQDEHGRGPFKPGFSHVWADENFAPGIVPLPTLREDFGPAIYQQLVGPYHYGTAVRDKSMIGKWFSCTEQAKLFALGFSLVSLRPDVIIAESEHQVLFGRIKPFTTI